MLLGCALGGPLAGCTVGPDFHPPTVAAPTAWGPERADVPSRTLNAAIDPNWWKRFDDPELASLVDRLAAQNLDLKTAAERVLQSRDQRRIVASQGLPSLDAQATVNHNRLSTAGLLGLLQPAPGASPSFDIFQEGLSASWELDLFARVRRAVEAENAATEAAIEARHDVALTAIADLVQDYAQLRGVQADVGVARDSLGIATENIGLVRTRIANGYATDLDLAQAQAQQSDVASTLPDLRTRQAALINAMGLLLGEPPRALAAELAPVGPQLVPPAEVAIGLPGTLVRQRPDVRQAEAKLHQATAETGVAVASFYPDVTLVGTANLQSLELRDAFNIGSRAFDVGPSVTLPIFQGGRLRGQLQLRRSRQRVAAIDFQKTVLSAWREVDDALTAYAEAQHRRDEIARTVAADGTALRAARTQYAQGFVDFLNVNAAQERLLQNRSSLADAITRVGVDLVVLYRSLGGGWQMNS